MPDRFEAGSRIGVGAVRISDREKQYVREVLDSNRLSYGPFSRKLESRFAEAHDCDHGILSNSGTSSLQVAVAALKEKHGWVDGDEILCPAATFVATSNVILQNNLIPSFVDVEPKTFEDLHLPEVCYDLAQGRRGMILITGPTGSGKTTTLAAFINHINENRREHIVTIEHSVASLFCAKVSEKRVT